jgi:hypothetical protein
VSGANEGERKSPARQEKLAETERLEAASRAAKAALPERFTALKKEMLLPVLAEENSSPDRGGRGRGPRPARQSTSTL